MQKIIMVTNLNEEHVQETIIQLHRLIKEANG